MEVETVHGLTGHSGRNQLVSYIHRMGARPERIIVNHGDPRKISEFSRDLRRMFRAETLAPKNLESVRLK